MGAVTQQCNVNTGCCFCRDQYTGEKCNECKLGYRNFPHCISCDCSLSGSNAETCDAEAGVCACAERTGQCSCKVTPSFSSFRSVFIRGLICYGFVRDSSKCWFTSHQCYRSDRLDFLRNYFSCACMCVCVAGERGGSEM